MDNEPLCVSCGVVWGEYAPPMVGAYRVGLGTRDNPFVFLPLCEPCLDFAENVVRGLALLWRDGVAAIGGEVA